MTLDCILNTQAQIELFASSCWFFFFFLNSDVSFSLQDIYKQGQVLATKWAGKRGQC